MAFHNISNDYSPLLGHGLDPHKHSMWNDEYETSHYPTKCLEACDRGLMTVYQFKSGHVESQTPTEPNFISVKAAAVPNWVYCCNTSVSVKSGPTKMATCGSRERFNFVGRVNESSVDAYPPGTLVFYERMERPHPLIKAIWNLDEPLILDQPANMYAIDEAKFVDSGYRVVQLAEIKSFISAMSIARWAGIKANSQQAVLVSWVPTFNSRHLIAMYYLVNILLALGSYVILAGSDVEGMQNVAMKFEEHARRISIATGWDDLLTDPWKLEASLQLCAPYGVNVWLCDDPIDLDHQTAALNFIRFCGRSNLKYGSLIRHRPGPKGQDIQDVIELLLAKKLKLREVVGPIRQAQKLAICQAVAQAVDGTTNSYFADLEHSHHMIVFAGKGVEDELSSKEPVLTVMNNIQVRVTAPT